MNVQIEFSTIAEMFLARTRTEENTSKPVYSRKAAGKYEKITYKQLREMTECFAIGLLEIGVKRGDRVGIISENRLEWPIVSFAISCIGAADVPIFPMLSAKQVEYIYENCGAICIIVSNAFQLGKVLKALPQLPELRHIIVMNDDAKGSHYLVKTMSQIMMIGNEAMPPEERSNYFASMAAQVEPDNLVSIIYTSGTTGNPKGVMLTHRNLCANIFSTLQAIPITSQDVFLSYLPLCHSYERTAGFYCSFASGAVTAFAESIERVPDNIREVQPTILTSVPQLFERIRHRTLASIEKESPAKKKIFAWALRIGAQYILKQREHGNIGVLLEMQYRLADKLVFSKIRERLGGRLRLFVSGGASLPVETAVFFALLGFAIIEGYGLTESSPILTANRQGSEEIGTVGKPLANVEIQLADDGEILARGPNIMKGYWNDLTSTDEAIDKDGWLHTGDVGVFSSSGNLKITDRKKHIFVSSGGKNITPLPIESAVAQSKYVEYCILIGEKREFCCALIAPNFTELKNELQEIANLPDRELASHSLAYTLIEKEIAERLADFAKYERIRRFVILAEPLTIETGELTPKYSVKRKSVEAKYADAIKKLYEKTDN